jgi:hypothetical protein
MNTDTDCPPCTDEEFMQRHLPDLGHEIEETQVFSWKMTNWKKLDKKLYSPDFACGGHRWSVSAISVSSIILIC